MATGVWNVSSAGCKYWILAPKCNFMDFNDHYRGLYKVYDISRPVSEPLGCSLVKFSSFVQGCERWSVLAGSSDRGVEISCGSAVGCLIILPLCVRVPKRSFYEDLVTFGCWIVSVLLVEASKVGENWRFWHMPRFILGKLFPFYIINTRLCASLQGLDRI